MISHGRNVKICLFNKLLLIKKNKSQIPKRWFYPANNKIHFISYTINKTLDVLSKLWHFISSIKDSICLIYYFIVKLYTVDHLIW